MAFHSTHVIQVSTPFLKGTVQALTRPTDMDGDMEVCSHSH